MKIEWDSSVRNVCKISDSNTLKIRHKYKVRSTFCHHRHIVVLVRSYSSHYPHMLVPMPEKEENPPKRFLP